MDVSGRVAMVGKIHYPRMNVKPQDHQVERIHICMQHGATAGVVLMKARKSGCRLGDGRVSKRLVGWLLVSWRRGGGGIYSYVGDMLGSR